MYPDCKTTHRVCHMTSANSGGGNTNWLLEPKWWCHKNPFFLNHAPQIHVFKMLKCKKPKSKTKQTNKQTKKKKHPQPKFYINWRHKISPIKIWVNWPGSKQTEPGQFTLLSRELIKYSCSSNSGHHELIHVKFGVWGFFMIMTFYWSMVMKMLKCKKENSHFSTHSKPPSKNRWLWRGGAPASTLIHHPLNGAPLVILIYLSIFSPFCPPPLFFSLLSLISLFFFFFSDAPLVTIYTHGYC